MDCLRDVTERVNIIKSVFSLEVQTKKKDSGFPKSVLRKISFCIAAPNENQNFQKLHFDFSDCKLPELDGCFTALSSFSRNCCFAS